MISDIHWGPVTYPPQIRGLWYGALNVEKNHQISGEHKDV